MFLNLSGPQTPHVSNAKYTRLLRLLRGVNELVNVNCSVSGWHMENAVSFQLS